MDFRTNFGDGEVSKTSIYFHLAFYKIKMNFLGEAEEMSLRIGKIWKRQLQMNKSIGQFHEQGMHLIMLLSIKIEFLQRIRTRSFIATRSR